MHDDHPRYATLRDYLGLLRRRRLLIIAVTLAFGLAGLGLSLSQESKYEASASIAFRDVTSDLPLLGGSGLPEILPTERAARNAQLMTSDAIAQRAAVILQTDISPGTLSAEVSADVGVQTNLVVVTAAWGEAAFAARLANAVAEAAVERASRDEKKRLDSALAGLEERLDGTKKGSLQRQFVLQQIAQLQAVREIANAAEIIERAETPSTPTSPRPVRNTVLGLIAGLAFGLLAAFMRDILDRKIRSSREAHDELGLPVLGRIGTKAFGSVGQAGGLQPMSPQDLESIRVLRTNLSFFETDEPLRTVLVTSGLAEEGKSTVAASLAAASAAVGQRTLLVDCDLRRPMLADRLGLQRSPGLAEYLAGRAAPSEILQLRALSLNGSGPAHAPLEQPQPGGGGSGEPAEVGTQAPPEGGGERESAVSGSQQALAEPLTVEQPANGLGHPAAAGLDRHLVCITAGVPPEAPAELLATDRLREFLDKVGKAYDLVVIDSSPMLAAVDPLELIPLVDAILVCVRVSRSTRDEARAVKHALGRLPKRPTGIVVTGLKADSDDQGYYGYYGYEESA